MFERPLLAAAAFGDLGASAKVGDALARAKPPLPLLRELPPRLRWSAVHEARHRHEHIDDARIVAHAGLAAQALVELKRALVRELRGRADAEAEEMIAQSHGGVGLRHITKGKLEAIKIPLPPLDEQRRIVGRIKECLSRVEEIERLRQESRRARSHLLESLIEETFHISSGDEVALFDICSIASALVSPNAPQYQQLPHVGGANIEPATGAIRDLKTVAEEKVTSAKFIFDSRMVLYNKIRPYLKKVTKPEFSGLCSADMYPLLPQSGRISKDYLFYVLLSRSFTNYAINGSNRAGMPKVNRNHLFAYRFRLPPIETQQSICLRLDYAFKSVQRLREETSATDLQTSSLRESILRKAFAGEL